jgi:hypothetical protein
VTQKLFGLYVTSIINVGVLLTLVAFTILIIKNETLLRKPSQKQAMHHNFRGLGIIQSILNSYFRGVG